MSEALPGVPEAPPVPVAKDASAVVLFRRAPGGAEVFWLKRQTKLRFAGGFYAFPGGRLDAADAQVPVEGLAGHGAALVVCAARELLEETGVLVAHGADRLSRVELDGMRRALLDEVEPFGALLASRGLALRGADFLPAGRWVTPTFMRVGRFDARFFLVEAPPGQRAEVWPGELEEGEWIRPAAALERWAQGTALLHPPNLHAVQSMARFESTAQARELLAEQPHCVDSVAHRLQFQRGVHLWPLVTPTLPPATHTNAWVLGTRQLVVVDPGSPDDAETDTLVHFLSELKAEGHELVACVLTHHHADHVGGVPRLVERLGLPLWAHPLTAERLPWRFQRLLEDGDVIALDGPLPMRWRVLHTPGHARGHLCLVDEASRAAVVGDLVAGIGTIVIDPPEGDMAQYLAQLERLKALPVGTINPAHGPVIPAGVAKLDEYLAHRAWRREKVLGALRTLGEATTDALVPMAYDDAPALVWPIAERNTLAILEQLASEGRARRDGDRWKVVSA